MTERLVTLGRVAGVFGVRGWLRVQSFTRPIDNLLDYAVWELREGRAPGRYQLVSGRVQGNALIVQLAGADGVPIEDRDRALALVGAEMAVARSALPEPEDGQVYWVDLIGCQVLNEQQLLLGHVVDMISNGAQDVMVLRDDAVDPAVERMIPLVRGPIVKSVDLAQRRIIADWQPDY